MLTKQQICKLNDVEPTENVLKAMEEWGEQRNSRGWDMGVATMAMGMILLIAFGLIFYVTIL